MIFLNVVRLKRTTFSDSNRGNYEVIICFLEMSKVLPFLFFKVSHPFFLKCFQKNTITVNCVGLVQVLQKEYEG